MLKNYITPQEIQKRLGISIISAPLAILNSNEPTRELEDQED
jgi:hypothetical protein